LTLISLFVSAYIHCFLSLPDLFSGQGDTSLRASPVRHQHMDQHLARSAQVLQNVSRTIAPRSFRSWFALPASPTKIRWNGGARRFMGNFLGDLLFVVEASSVRFGLNSLKEETTLRQKRSTLCRAVSYRFN
jgi:hypothetical protein